MKNYKFETKETLIRRKFAENDEQLQCQVGDLVKNETAMGLVKAMEPLDIAHVIAVGVELCPHDAAQATLNLLKHAHGVTDDPEEGINSMGRETNMEYPIPAQSRNDGQTDEEEMYAFYTEASLGRPQGKSDITPKYDYPRYYFPADPDSQPDDWPYDGQQIAAMRPGNKGVKRGLTTAKEPVLRKKYIFKQASTTPWSPGIGGAGTQQSSRGGDGAMPGGGSSFCAGNVDGWSGHLSDQEFDLPNEIPKDDEEEKDESVVIDDEEPLNFQEPAPVGSSIPNMGHGDRMPGRRLGFRRK